MLLLSDFDGVWTHPGREGLAQGRAVDERLAEWAAADGVAGVAGWLAARRAAFAAKPRAHGWDSNGRLSAYADEDPFIMHAALLRYVSLAPPGDTHARWLAGAIARHGFDSADAFGSATHDEAVRRVERERGPALLADAAEAGRRMLAAGVGIVVVSNSPAEKLERWFASAGLATTRDPARSPGALRLRGGARKFELGEPPRALTLGGVRFEVARERYREALEAERPDAVVGDVFSLDLALPLALRRGEPKWGALRLFWLVRDDAPSWLVTLVAQHAPEVERVAGLGAVAEALHAPPA